VTLAELMDPMLGLQLTGVEDDPDEDCISLVFGSRYFKSLPEKQPATDYEDEEDSPHEGMHGSIVQLTEHEKPVRVKKKPKIGFY
jgi:hypothetical protein